MEHHKLSQSYLELPETLYTKTTPTPVKGGELLLFNEELCTDMGMNPKELREDASYFMGNRVTQDMQPFAQAYAGHQFGHFTILGDGRAIVLGEWQDQKGKTVDIQLKGSGPTKYSRGGDGRATLGSMIREYIMSEAMHGLGIPTTRSLAVATTGETVFRDRAQPGAILTRIASSHLRVGTFQYAYALGQEELLETLTLYAIQRHDPDLLDHPDRIGQFLERVIKRQATLIAQWMSCGFIHGVMNTDNVSIAGETIDYGPCAFLEVVDLDEVFSSIDHNGRYRYRNQPQIAQWNMARWIELYLNLLSKDRKVSIERGNQLLEKFMEQYRRQYRHEMTSKLGLLEALEEDDAMIEMLLHWMQEAKVDYTNFFVELTRNGNLLKDRYDHKEFHEFYNLRQKRLGSENRSENEVILQMQQRNPRIMARNKVVEECIRRATYRQDLSLTYDLLELLKNPYDYHKNINKEFTTPMTEWERSSYQTFCGT